MVPRGHSLIKKYFLLMIHLLFLRGNSDLGEIRGTKITYSIFLSIFLGRPTKTKLPLERKANVVGVFSSQNFPVCFIFSIVTQLDRGSWAVLPSICRPFYEIFIPNSQSGPRNPIPVSENIIIWKLKRILESAVSCADPYMKAIYFFHRMIICATTTFYF